MAKLDGKRILACCANGAGSSLMMEKAIKKVLDKYGIKVAELRHCPVSERKVRSKKLRCCFLRKNICKDI